MVKYTVDDQFLDVIDSEIKAYWLGFMFADGYNSAGHKTNYKIALTLNRNDGYILPQFSAALGTTQPVYYDKRNCNTLEIHNKRLSLRLAELGCHRAKTLTVTFPEWIPEELLPHFIRGYIDGDGCIWFGEVASKRRSIAQLSVIGSADFITRLAEIVRVKCHVAGSIMPSKKTSGMSVYGVGGRDQVSIALAWLYKDATIYLERKKRVVEKILTPFIPKTHSCGENHPNSRLTADDVLSIKNEIESGQLFSMIADSYNIALSTVHSIASGNTWHNVTGWTKASNGTRNGIKGSQAKKGPLTEPDIREVVELIERGNSNSAIAKEFSVSEACISQIRLGKTWGHITGWTKEKNASAGTQRGKNAKRPFKDITR